MKINNNVLKYISFILLLFYPFNSTISYKIYPNNIVLLISLLIGFLLLILCCDFKNIKNYQILIFIMTIIAILFVYLKNYYFIEGRELYIIVYFIYMLLPLLLTFTDNETEEIFLNVLSIFIFEHIFFTLFIQIFKDFYVHNILTWLVNGLNDKAIEWNLNFWVEKGYNAGITTHYSTNAIYLAIGMIFFFCKFLFEKKENKKRNLIILLLTFIALLLTAKRAHILFSIITCTLVYILNNKENFNKKILNFCIFSFIGVFILFLLSSFVPEITHVFDRFLNGDFFNGRKIYYEECIKLFGNKIFFGNGWGYFSYYYEKAIRINNEFHFLDAHNVFLQLLCEVGVIGFIFFTGIFFYNLFKSKELSDLKTCTFNCFAFGYQIFFLLYCLTGNPLYDVQCFSIYVFVIGLSIKYYKEKRKESLHEEI